jgi:hypothetical protein
MIKRLIVGLCIAAGIVVGVTVVRTASAEPRADGQGPLCVLPQDLRYSPGALVEHEGQFYMCIFVYGENLAPGGVGWIKVSRTSTFVPQLN